MAGQTRIKDDFTPRGFFCPITMEVMKYPVLAMDGHSYERQAIEKWLSSGRLISPKTGALIDSSLLIPNHALQSCIKEFVTAISGKFDDETMNAETLEFAIRLREEDLKTQAEKAAAARGPASSSSSQPTAQRADIAAAAAVGTIEEKQLTTSSPQTVNEDEDGKQSQRFLRDAGLEHLFAKFKAASISSLDLLQEASNEDLKELGLTLHERLKLRKAFASLSSSCSSATAAAVASLPLSSCSSSSSSAPIAVVAAIDAVGGAFAGAAAGGVKLVLPASPTQAHPLMVIPFISDKEVDSALIHAAGQGNVDLVRYLLDQRGASITAKDAKHMTEDTALHCAARGHVSMVKLLLERGARVDDTNRAQQTPLYAAVYSGSLEIVTLLLDRGASIDVQDQNRDTPLTSAISSGHQHIVSFLLDRGAFVPNAENRWGQTLLDHAQRSHRQEIATLLGKRIYRAGPWG